MPRPAPPRPALLTGAAVLILAGTAACTSPGEPTEGDELLTGAAVAAVALQTLPDDPASVEPRTLDDGVGASLSYDGSYDGSDDGSDDGSVVGADEVGWDVGVGVLPAGGYPVDFCRDEFWDGCVSTGRDGGTLVVGWQSEEPEEDPGILRVVHVRDDGDLVEVGYSGRSVAADPRDQGDTLGVSVEDLAEVATDPRLSPTTSPEVVALGEPYEPGEPLDLPAPPTARLTPAAVAAVVRSNRPSGLQRVTLLPGAARTGAATTGAALRYRTSTGAVEVVRAEVTEDADPPDPCAEVAAGRDGDLGPGARCRRVESGWAVGDQRTWLAWEGDVAVLVHHRKAEPDLGRPAAVVRMAYRTGRGLPARLVGPDQVLGHDDIRDEEVDFLFLTLLDARLSPRTDPDTVRAGERLDPGLLR